MKRLEVWGGIECTVNRLGDHFYRQLDISGHRDRPADLNAIADLGIRTLRYPVLWEDVAPHGNSADWRWSDERLGMLQTLKIAPIVGLLHHGSGPAHTSLIDDEFPTKFAQYAAAAAERYPWVQMWTPINEPLTTARFSALYGFWYPHHRSDASFVRTLLNQCKATVLAMRAIRKCNPLAQLIQTEDLGKVYSSRHLNYQAKFENRRRWLTWDLLCGRVKRGHPLRSYLVNCGATPTELDWLASNPCPPDIIGINHYVTSNRYLHQDESWCPREHWGGNGREAYADIEAVRVLADPAEDVGMILRDAWRRYRIPVAVTEVHLGCSREEQLRWLRDVWEAAQRIRRDEDVDVRAVTAWALLGSYDWNSLLTRFAGHYEPGTFDLRSSRPRPTAMAKLVQSLCAGERAYAEYAKRMPLVEMPGWWHRQTRLLKGCAGVPSGPITPSPARKGSRPLLITGGSGTLGTAFARICEQRGIEYRLCLRCDVDIAVLDTVRRVLDEIRPWAVVNTAGYVRVDDAEQNRERCFRENTTGATALATACAERKLPLLTFSSDLVFDGQTQTPYLESHAPCPLNVYGSSKALAERSVLRSHADALVVRSSSFFGPWDRHNFLSTMLDVVMQGKSFRAIDDVVVSPTYVPDLVNASLDLLIDGERGVWHLANRGALTWADFARQAASSANVQRHIVPVGWRSLGLAAHRPRYSALSSERGLLLPTLDDAIERYLAQTRIAPTAAA
jgi:dTDP-4-dehydrorhamnose reductase